MVDQLQAWFGISGKVAAITGGGGVLCGAMSHGLARVGVRVAVLDISEAAAQRVVDEITAQGGEALAVPCDCLDRDSLAKARERVLDAYGPVDFLINGAGGNSPKATTSANQSFFDLPEEGFRWVFDLNLTTALLTTQVFARDMVDRGEGVIVNIASVNSFQPLTNIPAYSAAKAAIRNFTEWLAVHLSQNYATGIRVNAIAPGFYLTEQNRFLLEDADTGGYTPRGQKVVGKTPMARFGDPDELLGTLVWLLSPGAAFVHGVTVPVDGGFCAYSGV